MGSSVERRLRRQQKHTNGAGANPLAQLQKALADIQKVQGLGQATQGLEALVTELTALRGELKDALREAGDYRSELERQRAVFLRFLFYPDIILGSGPGAMAKFMAAEQRYRAEYDGMIFLLKLINWAKEAP